MKKNILKKIAAVILLSIGFQAVLPAAVYASGWPTVDALNGGINTSTNVGTHITSSQQILKTLKDYGLDTIAYTLAQKLGAKMANKLVNKANGGASGDSGQKSFIENFADYLSDSDMQQIDKFLTALTISNNPYANSLSQSIIKGTHSLSQGKSPLESFNLDKVVGANWKDFSTDANQGGWDGILALSNAANTNIGVQIIGKKELAKAKDAARTAEQLKLTATGIKPQGKCSLKWEDYKAKTLAIKEGRSTVQFAQQAQQQGALQDNGKPITDAQIRQLQTDNITAATGLAENYGGCLQEAINNPVGLVSQGVGEATSYALKQTQQVQGWGQIIAGIFVSMFGSFVQSGLSSLSGDFNSSKNKNIGGPEQLLTKNGQQVAWTKAPTNIVNMPETFPESISLTETEIDSVKDYLKLLGGDSDSNSIINKLADLDQCIPGPDYDYSNRLDTYVTMKTNRLTRKQVSGKNESKQEARADAAAQVEENIAEAKSKMELAIVDPRMNIPGAAVMKQEVDKLSTYRQKYQEKKTTLLEKQNALNILYKVQNEVTSSLSGLNTYIPGLPANLPFSNQSYLQLYQSGGDTALVTWAKKQKKIPTTIAEWNALTIVDDDGNFVDRDGAFAWAKSITGMTDSEEAALITGTAQQREQKRRDYVLAAPKTLDQKKTFVIGTAWDVWSFPERYMTDDKVALWNTINPTTGTSPASDFLAKKNDIRSEFNSMAEKISIKRTIDNAKLDYNDLQTSRDRVDDMYDDCVLMKRSIQNFSPQPGASNHAALKTYLTSIKNQFKIKEIRTAIEAGTSILSSSSTNQITGVTCDDNGDDCTVTDGNGSASGTSDYTNVQDLPVACSSDYVLAGDSYNSLTGIRTVRCEKQDDNSRHLTATLTSIPNSATPQSFVLAVADAYLPSSSTTVCVGPATCVNVSQRTKQGPNFPITAASLQPRTLPDIGQRLQQQPPRDVWGVLRQDNSKSLFCYFGIGLITYVDYPGAGINMNREKQEIRCDQASKWYVADRGDYIGYVFGDGF